MSKISEISPKHCANKDLHTIDKKRRKRLFFTFSTLFTILLFIILLLWLILHPAKPNFSLTQADVYQLNLSAPTHLLNSSIQLTLLSNNPNRKVGIYYDNLLTYADYRGQQITHQTSIPPFYQSHDESNVLTAFLQGTGLPVSPSFGYQIGRDRTNGKVVMGLKVDGKLRWRVGSWVSGAYRFNVDCVAIVAFGPYMSTAPLASMQGTRCSTTT